MPTAFSYARFSSSVQRKGSSLERQEKMIADWLMQHPEYQRSELRFRDLAKSGWKGEHIKDGGGFAKLLAAVEHGAIQSGDVVLVEAIDRAGRLHTGDMLGDVILPIVKAGVSIITLDDGAVYDWASINTPQSHLLLAKIQAAQQYSDNLSRRLKGSYDSRRRLAKEEKKTPKRHTPVWLTSKGEVIEEIAAQVKLAFELYTSGLGKAVIAKRMRDSGVAALAKTSGPGVEGWLRNEAAIGRWNGVQVYEPIVDLSLYQLAQLEREKRKTAPRAKTATHFLVGLVKCGGCGNNFIMRTIQGVQVSMRCRKRQELNGCGNKKVIPKEIIDTIYRLSSATAALDVVNREHSGVNEKAIVAAETRLLEISKQMQELAAAIVAIGFIPEVQAQLEQKQEEREAVERELTLLKTTIVPAANGWVEQGKVWELERNDPQRLAAMLRSVGYSITIYPDARIVSSHQNAIYRYAGVDRRENKYKLMQDDKLTLVLKGAEQDYPYWEPFEEVAGEVTWNDEDYENLRQQYE
ncbi:recombinase family protein [Pseudomonas guariconensis]|uniref:recombinase family protein n=1 Tax=Pseudomonas guariconensis TaxID=1288410 RepID=UPI0018AB16D0|nr:recombinase family protein [Pseudomonas guariconensis]MBF8740221.1 recombinase family protein [Pseudomonas guariconensis]MBF8750364.1 recombinase family protein [Pseudomonas guariconensis]